MKGTLATLFSIIFLFWSFNGERTHQKYHFNGKIEDETVRFSEYYILGKKMNQLTTDIWIKGTYSKHVNYIDDNDDLKVDHVNLYLFDKSKDQETREFHYSLGEFDNSVMHKAQVQFDSYLQKISEAKTAEALEHLKGKIR